MRLYTPDELVYAPPIVSRSLKFGAALAALICVLTIFIAPMIDMPETVLREHHITSHAAPGQFIGKLDAVSGPDSFHVEPALPSLYGATGSSLSAGAQSETALVLRC